MFLLVILEHYFIKLLLLIFLKILFLFDLFLILISKFLFLFPLSFSLLSIILYSHLLWHLSIIDDYFNFTIIIDFKLLNPYFFYLLIFLFQQRKKFIEFDFIIKYYPKFGLCLLIQGQKDLNLAINCYHGISQLLVMMCL